MRNSRSFIILFSALLLGLGVASEEPPSELETLREAHQGKRNELAGKKDARIMKLEISYVSALDRLKKAIGAEEKLAAAAQVLAEINRVKAGEKEAPLPSNADPRLKRLRATWDTNKAKIIGGFTKDIRGLSQSYTAELGKRRTALTRAGEIETALEFEGEIQRIASLPENESGGKALLTSDDDAPLSERLPGTVWRIVQKESGERVDEYELTFGRGDAQIAGKTYSLQWQVTPEGVVELDTDRWIRTTKIKFNAGLTRCFGEASGGGTPRATVTGKRIDRK